MFDISFSELLLVFVVGLVVLGPKRLPVAIRTVVGWIRTLRSLANNVQNELVQELKLQELQENIKKAEQFDLKKLSPELSKTVEELKQSALKVQEELGKKTQVITSTVEKQVEAVAQPLSDSVEAMASSVSVIEAEGKKTEKQEQETAEAITTDLEKQREADIMAMVENAPMSEEASTDKPFSIADQQKSSSVVKKDTPLSTNKKEKL